MKYYVTFGQGHQHRRPRFLKMQDNGDPVYREEIFDRNCVATLTALNMHAANARAHELFGDKFFTVYLHVGAESEKAIAEWYPRGETAAEDES